MDGNKPWWQTGIIYEVYIRSFQDSNGDGTGDLRGIIQRLDYLQSLGVQALWITPFFPSPMKDLGYDISDYEEVDLLFGTMEDFEDLLQKLHQRNMKLIIDFVPNHTSDQHPWFVESRSSNHNSKRNWYYWLDATEEGGPPNNWLSILGGPAWEWDATSNQYYYHAFLKEQPDLNLTNPEVVEALLNIMRFWLDKGVDGLRIDSMWHLAKDRKWRDNPINSEYDPENSPDCDQLLQIFSCNQPFVHDLVYRFRKLMDCYPNTVMLGELYLPIHQVVSYYGANNEGVHLPGNFQLLLHPWNPKKIQTLIDQYEAALPLKAWPNWVIGNHDKQRLIDRIGREQCKIAAMLLLTLRGTPIMYYGDEIGMENMPVSNNQCKDVQGRLMPNKGLCRDSERSPMQWNSSANAGFTAGISWLDVNENYHTNNIEVEMRNPQSLLIFYRKLIAFRQEHPSLFMGDYYPIVTNGDTLSYIRTWKDYASFLIVLNLTDKPKLFQPMYKKVKGTIVFGTDITRHGQNFSNSHPVKPNEGLIVQIE